MNPNAPVTEDVIHREIDYTLQIIQKVKKNESPWNYLRGLAFKYDTARQTILVKCEELIRTDAYHNNSFAVGLTADLR
jgi:hypothetical protein